MTGSSRSLASSWAQGTHGTARGWGGGGGIAVVAAYHSRVRARALLGPDKGGVIECAGSQHPCESNAHVDP
jgi:hypothetical protein